MILFWLNYEDSFLSFLGKSYRQNEEIAIHPSLVFSIRCAWDGEAGSRGAGLAGRFSATSSSERQCDGGGGSGLFSDSDSFYQLCQLSALPASILGLSEQTKTGATRGRGRQSRRKPMPQAVLARTIGAGASTPLAKILHCRRHWRHGQIPPLSSATSWLHTWHAPSWGKYSCVPIGPDLCITNFSLKLSWWEKLTPASTSWFCNQDIQLSVSQASFPEIWKCFSDGKKKSERDKNSCCMSETSFQLPSSQDITGISS